MLNAESEEEEARYAVKEGKEIFTNRQAVLFVTRKGVVKKTVLSEFQNVTKNGIKAINIDDDDELVSAELVERGDEVIVASAFGQAVHFTEDQLRPLGRASRGVRGIRLAGVTFADADEDADEEEDRESPDGRAPSRPERGSGGAEPPGLLDVTSNVLHLPDSDGAFLLLLEPDIPVVLRRHPSIVP